MRNRLFAVCLLALTSFSASAFAGNAVSFSCVPAGPGGSLPCNGSVTVTGTNVGNGTLLVPPSSGVTGSVLAGYGVSGSLTLYNETDTTGYGGSFYPLNTPGTLTLGSNGSLSLVVGSDTVKGTYGGLQVSAGSYDSSTGLITGYHVNLSGLTFTGLPATIANFLSSVNGAGTWDAIDLQLNNNGSNNNNSITGTVNQSSLIIQAPEPGSLALLGSGMLGAAGFIRRKMVKL